jgi:hypothetical protein
MLLYAYDMPISILREIMHRIAKGRVGQENWSVKADNGKCWKQYG